MRTRLFTSHPHLLAGLCFLVLTVAMTWPVVTQLNTHVTPGQQPVMTVPYLNLWTLAWNHHWLKGQTDSYWDANLFFPHQKTLAYSEPQFGMGLLTLPLVLLGANTVFAYNFLLLGFVWGAGLAVYALCWYLFRDEKNSHSKVGQGTRWAAAVTAGILYGFHFYTFAEMGVLQLVATLFPALTFLGLHRFLESNRWRDVLLFCVGFLGCWYTCSYYGLFLSVFVACFVLTFGLRKALQWNTLSRGLVTAAIAFVSLLPLVAGMQSAKTAMALSRPTFVVRNLSSVLSDYLRLPQNSWFYGKLLDIGTPDRGLFLGGWLVCLACIGTIVMFQTRVSNNTALPPSGESVQKKRVRQTAPFPRRYGVFYLAMASVAFWLSFGMAVTPANATGLGVYRVIAWLSPYNLLYQFVPGFSSIRSPYRFSIFCVLFLSVLAGWGMLRLFQRVRPHWHPVLVPVLVIAVLLELWPLPLRVVKVPGSIEDLPRIYQHVKALRAEATLLELPLARGASEQELETEARALYHSTFHWLRITNGYSGFTPRANIELKKVIVESGAETVLAALKTFGIQYVLTHEEELNENEKQKLLALEGNGLIPIAREGENRLYQVALNGEKGPFPGLASLTCYESRTSRNHVTLRLNYLVNENQCELTTPWHRRIECEVAWYATSKGDEPVLISKGVHQNSQLLTQTSNAVELDLPAPSPGEYRVVVQRSETENFTKSGICRISENGFVVFHNAE